jgi:hypothetical protein
VRKPRRFVYVGGLDAVLVVLPSGRTLEARRGEPVDLLPIEVAALSSNPEWRPASSATPKKETA